MIPMFPMGEPIMAASASTGAATMEVGALRIEAGRIGMTVQGGPVVREAVTHTGMMAPEVRPAGGGVRRPGTMARVISADIGEAPRIGEVAPVVRLDGVVAPHRGAADRDPSTARVVAPVRGGAERASASKPKAHPASTARPSAGGKVALATVAWRAAF